MLRCHAVLSNCKHKTLSQRLSVHGKDTHRRTFSCIEKATWQSARTASLWHSCIKSVRNNLHHRPALHDTTLILCTHKLSSLLCPGIPGQITQIMHMQWREGRTFWYSPHIRNVQKSLGIHCWYFPGEWLRKSPLFVNLLVHLETT